MNELQSDQIQSLKQMYKVPKVVYYVVLIEIQQ